MRPRGSPKALERRRQQAIALLERGWSLKEVARRVGASFSSVFRWQQAVLEEGPAALKAKPVPGRPRKLREDECRRFLKLLSEGALVYGFPNDLWTLKRITTVIRREFGVVYHPNHLWRLLRRAGWSCQVPERRAIQRDDEAIAHGKRYKWPHIKKGATTWGPSGFPR
jgi:transposase